MSFKRTVVMKVESIFFLFPGCKNLDSCCNTEFKGTDSLSETSSSGVREVFSASVCSFQPLSKSETLSALWLSFYVASFIDRTDVYFAGVSWRELLKPAFVFTDEAGTDTMSQTTVLWMLMMWNVCLWQCQRDVTRMFEAVAFEAERNFVLPVPFARCVRKTGSEIATFKRSLELPRQTSSLSFAESFLQWIPPFFLPLTD